MKMCLEDFGHDAAVDYKAANFQQALAAASPKGVDVYYDNTSGSISDAVVARINKFARIVICGTASVANWDPWSGQRQAEMPRRNPLLFTQAKHWSPGSGGMEMS